MKVKNFKTVFWANYEQFTIGLLTFYSRPSRAHQWAKHKMLAVSSLTEWNAGPNLSINPPHWVATLLLRFSGLVDLIASTVLMMRYVLNYLLKCKNYLSFLVGIFSTIFKSELLGTKEPLDEDERREWKSWLKTQHSKK